MYDGVPARKIYIGGTTPMATAPSYMEQQVIPRENGLIENLMDFSFQRMVTPRMLKMLYGVHLLIGLVAAVWFVFSGFQTSTSNGLLALILGFAAMLLWIVYCRIVVELLAGIFRAVQVITNSQG
jgi:zinc transporter ZupT